MGRVFGGHARMQPVGLGRNLALRLRRRLMHSMVLTLRMTLTGSPCEVSILALRMIGVQSGDPEIDTLM